MKTNDLKKGTEVLLKNGWMARIEDNRRGNRRCMTVFGDFTEMGDVYSHDIAAYLGPDDQYHFDIEYTASQIQLEQDVKDYFNTLDNDIFGE